MPSLASPHQATRVWAHAKLMLRLLRPRTLLLLELLHVLHSASGSKAAQWSIVMQLSLSGLGGVSAPPLSVQFHMRRRFCILAFLRSYDSACSQPLGFLCLNHRQQPTTRYTVLSSRTSSYRRRKWSSCTKRRPSRRNRKEIC